MSRPGEIMPQQQQQQQQQQQHLLPPEHQHLGNRSLLEQKLELLERRFTEPLENRNSPFTGSSSTATINPFSSPFGINNSINNPNASQHSFSFDTPSLSNTAFPHSNSVCTTITNQKTTTGAAAAAAASGTAASSVGLGLQAVEQATARHMQRLLTTAHTRSSQAIVVAASDTSQNHDVLSNNSSSSRSTLVAGNKTNGRGTNKTRQTRLSPLPLKENADASNNSKKSSKNAKKRKSAVPAKIHIPSVQEEKNLVGDDDHQPQNGKNINNNNNNNHTEEQQRKRTRSSSTSRTSDKAAATTAVPPSLPLKQQSAVVDTSTAPSNTTTTTAAAAAAPVTSTTTTGTTSTDSNGSSGNSRANSKSSGDAEAKSNKQSRQRNCSKSFETTTSAATSTANSRDANNDASKSYNNKVVVKKPAHNALICDYFLSTTSRKKATSTTSSMASVATTTSTGTTTTSAPSSTTKRKLLEGKDAKPSKATNTSSKTTSPTPRRTQQQPIKKSNNENQSQTKLLEELQRRVKELEDIAHDKDQQLKAVANNRTILHTALKSALNQREKELDDLANAKSEWEARARLSMEVLVRSEAEQDAKDLQERVATDGARLGRIVQSRSSSSSGGGRRMMNSGFVETWEEGYASRNLQTKRLELQERKVEHETRLAQAQKAAGQLKAATTDEQENQTNGTATTSEGKDDEAIVLVGGVPLRSLLDVRAQLESCRYHLQNISREEKELAAEEQKLNEEKGSHIRLLKRVASEEASRFRSRPKLHDRYVLKRLLGKGGFSEVWRAFDLVELCEVAVKIHQLDPRWSDSKKENYTKHVSREYEIHRSVRHPRIVSLLDVFEIDNHSFATVLEICDGTDLDTLLKKKRRLAEQDARAILLQILSGMQYLSQPSADGSRQGIIHYDLKPGNILFDTLGDAKITDFGLSKIVDDGDSGDSMELTSQGAGTYWYLPPECFMLDENPRISNKVDVWSIGVIFYQMLFGKRPFGDGESQDKILSDRTILNAHEVTFPDNPKISDDCKEFIKTCLSYDQAFRPTIAQLCQHPFVLTKEL